MKQISFILLTLFSLNTFAQSTSWNEYKLKEHWEKNGADEFEGIYVRNRKIINCNGFGNCKTSNYVSGEDYYVVKYNDGYIMASFDKKMFGTMKKVFSSKKFFLSLNEKYWYNSGNLLDKTVSLFFNNSNEFVMEDFVARQDYSEATIKDVFSPIYKPEKKQKNEQYQKLSGTGFAISSNGIIVTNYHVIENAKTIKVRGVNSDFNKSYTAKVLVSDKNNDLALIQIDDYGFTSLGTTPYTLKTKLANAGESIFALGYPLRAVMGDEIKLTNGIISSKTGFQGDITSYQVSAPVQPGNSGGPLFDNNGNIIGIINAKLTIAENASYAVKTSYLMNLIDLLDNPPKLSASNTLTGKSLATQVQIVNKFVYIIETE